MQAFNFFFAMVVVLALIGAAFWLVRRFGGNRIGASAKGGRLPRLAVIDATPVDNRRRLVLVRRDNIEHLLMIGGPTDIVVEPNIVRAVPAREAQRASLPDPASWAENELPRAESLDLGEPPMAEPPPPPRPARPSFVEEARRPPPPPAMPERRERPVDRGADRGDIGGFAPEPMLRPAPELRPEPPVRPRSERSEPMMPRPAARAAEPPKAPPVRAERPVAAPLAPAAAPAAPAASSADQNLAEMAQRLEAALRQPGRDPRSPPVAPEAPPAARPARAAPEVKIDSPVETSSAPPVAPPKATFEDLEEEMASLLGRPKPPT